MHESQIARWNAHYAVLQRRFNEGADVYVPRGVIVEGLPIGEWLYTQRRFFRLGKLSSARISRLEAIGVELQRTEVDVKKAQFRRYADQWQSKYLLLKRCYDELGDANVGPDAMIDGCNIGSWLHAQRFSRRRGRLTREQINQLEAIGVDWAPTETKRRHLARWAKHLEVLQARHLEGLNVNVTANTVINGLNIGTWLITQRVKHEHNNLAPDLVRQLEAIGVEWRPKERRQDAHSKDWEDHYAALKRLVDQGNDANLPYRIVIDGMRLGGWLKRQRERYRAGGLSTDRATRLEAIGVKWRLPIGRPAAA